MQKSEKCNSGPCTKCALYEARGRTYKDTRSFAKQLTICEHYYSSWTQRTDRCTCAGDLSYWIGSGLQQETLITFKHGLKNKGESRCNLFTRVQMSLKAGVTSLRESTCP